MAKVPIRDLKARYLRGIENGLDDVADAFLMEATQVISRDAVDTGDLLRSSEVERKPAERIIRWTSSHAAYVHYGTRPHWAPIAPIVAWVRRNLARITLTTGERVDVLKPTTRQGERATRSPDATILRVAYAVRAKIAREGTAPVAWVPRAWSRVKPKSAAMLQEAISEALE